MSERVYARGFRPCAGTCGRMTRPNDVPKAEAPDTVVRKVGGKCALCANGREESKPPIRPCEGTCGRMTRHSRLPAASAPDTVPRADGRFCGACYAMEYGRTSKARPVDYTPDQRDSYVWECGGTCGRITRPSWMTVGEAPDTVQRRRGRECRSCAKAAGPAPVRRKPPTLRVPGPSVPDVPEREQPNLDAPAAHGLASFLQRSRERRQRNMRSALNSASGTGRPPQRKVYA